MLSDDRDKYMITQCDIKDKYIVVMLKEDIDVEAFSLVNYEFYSSNVKDIEVIG